MFNFLKFNQIERIGIVSLLLVAVAIFCAPYYFPNKNVEITFEEVKSLEEAEKQLVSQNVVVNQELKLQINEPFNPNKNTLNDWLEIGLPKNIAERIVKYTSKGGVFKNKNDLKKIYGFKKEWYYQLEPFIALNDSKSEYIEKVKVTKSLQVYDLNTVDSIQLQTLNGIGEVLASRIVKYRNKLGGFASLNQLSEVYGLSQQVIEENKNRLTINKSQVKKLNLYKVDFKTLSKHPYFGYKNTKIWMSYRNQHSDLKSIQDLLKVRELQFEHPEYLEGYFILSE